MNIKSTSIGIASAAAMAVSLFSAAHANPIGCYAVAGNMVANCGFETGNTSSWNVISDGGASAGVTNATSNSGTYALALTGPGGSGSDVNVFQFIPTQSGTTYDVTFYVMGSYSGQGFVAVGLGGNTAAGSWSTSFGLSLSSWTKESFTFTADSSSSSLYAFMGGNGMVGTLYFDDFSMTPEAVPEPGSLALLATGLLSAGVFGWRQRNRKDAL